MKILLIHCAYQYKGGECVVVEEEMKLLQSLGHTVTMLPFYNGRHELLNVLQLPFNLSSYIKTIKKIKAFQPDIVHLHNLHFAASASVIYAIKRKKIPFVITLHNFRLLCPSATLFFDGKPFLDSLHQNFSWAAVKKGVYQNSSLLTFWLSLSMQLHQKLRTWQIPDKYIVLSQHGKDLFGQSKLKLKEKQLVIKPNFSLPPVWIESARNNHFLFVGRLSKEKGIELLLETFAQLEYTIKIAGDGPCKNLVMDYCKRFPNIQYLGILKKEQVHAELQSCSALVFPSIWYEGMPLTIIESFACSTPVIASKLGAMQSMIRHEFNGLHFDPESKDDLILELEKWFMMNDAVKKRFRSNALETYQQYYTPEKNANQLVAIYASVISKKKALAPIAGKHLQNI